MNLEGSYEVFVLLDEACDLRMRGQAMPGFTGLDLAACQVIAAGLAQDAEERVVSLPGSVAQCVDEAARRAAAWDPAQVTSEARRLVLMLSDLRLDLTSKA